MFSSEQKLYLKNNENEKKQRDGSELKRIIMDHGLGLCTEYKCKGCKNQPSEFQMSTMKPADTCLAAVQNRECTWNLYQTTGLMRERGRKEIIMAEWDRREG